MRRCIDLLDSTGEALLMSTTETVLLLRLDDWSPSISTRLSNSTGNAGIEFIFQLVERTEEEVLKTKNFGRKCLNEVKELLADLSMRYRLVEPVRLGMTLPKSTVDRVRQTIRWS
jgi:DNA-directed RNA polymerase alpha subunit